MDKKKVGKFLKELRTEKGLTQTEFSLQFSKFCGIDAYGGFSCAAISKWERGETLPDLYNLRDIAKYYGVTVDEILEGGRHTPVDFNELYFGEHNCKERKRSSILSDISPLLPSERLSTCEEFWRESDVDLLKIQMHAEERYRYLLLALARNNISRTDEDEFDYLCLSYFKQYYCFEKGKQTIKSFNVDSLKYVKIDMKKLAGSLTSCSDEELLFEINRRCCVCNFMPMVSVSDMGAICNRFRDLHRTTVELNNLFDLRPIYFDFVKSLLPWDKDELLTITLDCICHDEDDDFDYSEDLVKEFIKSLIDCGATVNHAINYKRVLKNKKRYIARELAELYQTYCAPTIVYDVSQKRYVEVEHCSPDFGFPIFTAEHQREYAELEDRLLAGENELEPYCRIVRNRSIYDITYREYVNGRNKQSTEDLYENIDEMSVEEIKNKYFMAEGTI
ncbi:helix-turn-helix domain-containing protein [Pumilibacter muris]|uniref:helix-turn-helix domain-containing protein n=1 Tax=Pumilibacter muris TaxID=2941510 RepID=UPI00203CB97E|nr:helix-turn-helix transcriptional regulator [Pumilibacter muris]